MMQLVKYHLLIEILVTACYSAQGCSSDYNQRGPVTEDTLVTSYFSVEHHEDEHPAQCRVRYSVPLNATVYQGLRAANQQHGENFTYEYNTYQQFGHHIITINGVAGHDTTHWSLHHGDTLESAEYGVDLLHIETDNDLFLWRYTDYNASGFQPFNATDHCQSVTVDIIPALPLVDIVVYLSISTSNTAPFTNGTFTSTVCKRLVMVPPSSTLYNVTIEANDQAITLFLAEMDPGNNSITGLNGLMNQNGYSWRIYDVMSQEMFPADLTLMTIQDGGHYEYRFTADEPSPTQTPSELTTEGRGARWTASILQMILMLLIQLILFL